jgi:hypothetical protein
LTDWLVMLFSQGKGERGNLNSGKSIYTKDFTVSGIGNSRHIYL